jgi:hypothetical protein
MKPTNEETAAIFKKQWVAMKKAAVQYCKDYYLQDKNVLSVKVKLSGWMAWDEQEEDCHSYWYSEEGKPSREDLEEWGEMDILFSIELKMNDAEPWEKKNIIWADVGTCRAFFYDDGFAKKEDGQFLFEIR